MKPSDEREIKRLEDVLFRREVKVDDAARKLNEFKKKVSKRETS